MKSDDPRMLADDPRMLAGRLRSLGLQSDAWGETQGGETATSPVLERQKKALLKIRGLLAEQAESDKALLSSLHEKANRLQHGGGS